ncbi:MAG: Gfo/Idh/MocA family oxidoreductase [Emcibacteraceae bacterium]
MENKHIIIIGLGSIGQRHLRNIRKLYPESIITVVRRSLKNTVPCEDLADNIVNSIDRAIKISKPYACIIASPAPFHVQDALKFIEIGCPVLIEKPLSNQVSGVSDLIVQAMNNNTICMVAYVMRFLPTMDRIKEIINTKRYGEVITATISAGQYLPNWRPELDYRNTVSAQKKLGGGALLELSHEIDYMNYLFGMPSRVNAIVSSTNRLEIDVEDSVDCILEYASGHCLSLHLDFLQKMPTRFCEISFEQAHLRWEINKGHLYLENSNHEKYIEEVPLINNDTYISETEYFFECIAKSEKPSVGLKEGHDVLMLIEAMSISSNRKKSVELKMESDHQT